MNTNMRLSEAMRLGAMLRPQITGRLLSRWGSCALGAARQAAGVPTRETVSHPWVWTHTTLSHCPACRFSTGYQDFVEQLIKHLNDTHRWTRERIADWVESIEPQPETPVTPEAESCVVVA